MYQNIMFRWSTGALPISKLIEERIKKLARSDYPVLRIPVLVDADEVGRESNQTPTTPGAVHPYLFWCGMVDGYKRDPLYLISVLGEIGRRYALWPRLILGGPCSDTARKELLVSASEAGLEQGQVIATGFLPEKELFRLSTHATVALLPLWNDDRSATRFPTKLGLYAAAGRPVVASPIGEISHYLRDRETVLFASAGDVSAWADAIATLMNDPDLCARLVDRMQSDVLPLFEYRSVGPILKEWFDELYWKRGKK
jgi:glycosyltransferase involved in cell wall biosynthesis